MKCYIICMIFSLLFAVSSLQAQKQPKISKSQCRQVFPSASDYLNRQMPDETLYCEAWDYAYGNEESKLLGYVFLRTLPLSGKETELVIGVDTKGRIVNMKINEPMAGAEEFLAQFVGKSLNTSFEVAKSVEDLLYLPDKIKAIKDNIELSECIAKTAHEVLLSMNNSQATFTKK